MAKRIETIKKINAFLKKAQETEETKDEETNKEAPEEGVDAPEAVDEEEPEVAEEEATEKEEGGVEEKVETLEKTLDEVVEALEDQKEVIEELLDEDTEEVDEEEYDDNFKDYVEEQDDELNNEIDSDEFGVDAKQPITSKEDGMKNRKSLRELRKARLAKIATDLETSETLSEEFKEDESKAKDLKPLAPVVQKGEPPKTEIPELFSVESASLEQSDDKKAWNVLSGEKALYTIKQADLGVRTSEFATADFAKAVIKDMLSMGTRAALKKYRAKKIQAQEEVEEGIEDIIEKLDNIEEKIDAISDDEVAELPEMEETEELDEEMFAEAAAKKNEKKEKKEEKACNEKNMFTASDFRRRFLRAFRLALTAMNKNLVKPVPLKEAMFEVLSELDVDNPVAVIEACFQKGANLHFDAAIATAEKYLDMSDEAFVETEAMIGENEVAEVAAPVRQASVKASDLVKRASASSLPFDTATSSKDDFYSKLNSALPKPKLLNALKKR